MHLNHCVCEPNDKGPGVMCTEEEHQVNRRTEAVIVEMRNPERYRKPQFFSNWDYSNPQAGQAMRFYTYFWNDRNTDSILGEIRRITSSHSFPKGCKVFVELTIHYDSSLQVPPDSLFVFTPLPPMAVEVLTHYIALMGVPNENISLKNLGVSKPVMNCISDSCTQAQRSHNYYIDLTITNVKGRCRRR